MERVIFSVRGCADGGCGGVGEKGLSGFHTEGGTGGIYPPHDFGKGGISPPIKLQNSVFLWAF